MFADTEYPSLSGTATARDFVEFPSQFNEHWATYPAIFNHYARHYKTGAVMPQELARKIKRAENFNQGYKMTELLAAAELDMQWHMLPARAAARRIPTSSSSRRSRRRTWRCARCRRAIARAIFSTSGPAAIPPATTRIYGREMLADDAYQWFDEHGGLTRANGDRLRHMILSRGNTEDLAAMYADWRGRAPKVDAMLKYRGCSSPEARSSAQSLPLSG